VFLDEHDQPTHHDIGRMAMVIENNDAAQGVLVVAEIYGNNLDNDMVVRVINRNNNSIVSVFYRSRMLFPHSIFITVEGENILGTFSNYNHGTQRYSVTFTDDYGEEEIFENLVLNRNVFTLHQYYDGLSDTQNARLQNIITTLALWNSLAFQIEEDFEVVGIVPANIFRRWNPLTIVFAAVAVVAFVAVVILALPAAVAVAGPALTLAPLTTQQVVFAGIGFAASAAALINQMIVDTRANNGGHSSDGGGSGGHGTPGSNEKGIPSIGVTVAKTNKTVRNNGQLHYLAAPTATDLGESIAFNIRINDLAGWQAQDVIKGDFVLFYDPFRDTFINIERGNPFNAQFFDPSLDVHENGTIRFAVTRNSSGYVPDGRVQFVLQFRQDVSINGNTRGYITNSHTITQNAYRGNLFIFNFTVIQPQNETDE
jgi:hypothetical protein